MQSGALAGCHGRHTNMQMKTEPILLTILAGALALGACSSVGPKKKEGAAEPPKAAQTALYEYDLTKPDGPMYQMLRAAQERDEALFRASFAPSVDTSWLNENAFRKFRKKVLGNHISPVPESVVMEGDSNAVVRLRNARGREIPVKVTKVDGKWLIAEIQFGEKFKKRYNEKHPGAAPPAPMAPAAPAPAPTGKPA